MRAAMAAPRATSRPFVRTNNLLLLARAAETWGCRPSSLLGIDSDARNLTTALQIDLAAAAALWRVQAGEAQESGVREAWW